VSIVLGLDPGFASFGVAVVELLPDGERVLALEVLRTSKDQAKRHTLASDDNLRRAGELYRGLSMLMLSLRPAALAAESMSFPRSSSVAGKMCLSWGVVAALAGQFCLPLVQASPQTIKGAVVGDKSASKVDVESALLRRYGNGIEDLVHVSEGQHEHAFDALAAVVACLDSDVMRMARKGAP
jgi:Holliday junction resolvasome RuvABC endonuclease subunit